MDLGDLTHEVWAGLVGETFTVRVDDETAVRLELSSAEQAAGVDRPDSAHSVVFRGPGDVFLEQRTWPVSHPTIGEHQLFLVPIGDADGGYQYEAVFTRLNE